MKRINLKLTGAALLVIISLISAVLIYQNRIFHYSEFNDSVQVMFTKGTNEQMLKAIDSLKSGNTVSRVDRDSKVVYFQRTGIDDVKKNINEILKDNKDVTFVVSENITLTSNREVLIDYLIAIALIVVVALGALFYTVLRFFKNWKLKDYLKFFGVYLIISLITVNIQLGISSLASNFYEVKNLDLVGLIVSNLMIFTWFFIASYNFKGKNLTVAELLGEVTVTLREYFMTALKISLGVLVIVSFGFGANFVMTASLIFIALLLSFFVPFSFDFLIKYLRSTFRRLRLSRENSKKEIKVENKRQEVNSPNPAKKKDKKKDKKKKHR